MLLLSRSNGESVVIGDQDRCDRLLKVTVMEIGPGRITLGLDVDEHVPVRREETWERILAGESAQRRR